MGKINPFELARPKPVGAETLTFEDPKQPGKVLTLTLRPLEDDEQGSVVDSTAELYEKYLGDPESGIPPEAKFPAIGGRPVIMSRTLISNTALVTAMQCPDDPDDEYTFEQMVGIALTMPTAWRNVCRWVRRLGGKSPKEESDGGRQDGESSEQPSGRAKRTRSTS